MAKPKLKFKRTRFYPLTHSQWNIVKELFETCRKRKHDLRMVVNSILKITRTGVQWRNIDQVYPPWESCYYYFRKWQADGTWSKVLAYLVQKARIKQGREAEASRAAVDSQSVKKGSFVSLNTGFDGGKLINGRKRHLAVDTLGLPLAIHISGANIHDGEGGLELLWQLDQASKRLEMICADHAYGGLFKDCADFYQWKVSITQKPETEKGFVPQKGRWQVERSFAWLNFFRRLAKDFEKTIESSLAFFQAAFIDIILARLEC